MTPEHTSPVGGTSATVAENIRRLKQDQRFTWAALARELVAVGRPIPVLSLRRLVHGARRIDVDDLIAFALVLKVSPVDLLVPSTEDNDTRAWLCGHTSEAGGPSGPVTITLTSGRNSELDEQLTSLIRRYVRRGGDTPPAVL